MRKFALFLALVTALLMGGCAAPGFPAAPAMSATRGPAYKQQEFGVQRPVIVGTVQAVRDVTVEGDGGLAGTVGGGLLGAVIGNQLGGGLGKKLLTAAGGLGGAVFGNSVQKAATTVSAVEITVRLDSGSVVAILQPKEAGFAPKKGDQVRVIGERNNARVTPV